MDALQKDDVPYGNDWDSASEAAAYGDAADRARPWRVENRDHDGSPRNALYMTEQEQQHALAAAGFVNVCVELARNGLTLYGDEGNDRNCYREPLRRFVQSGFRRSCAMARIRITVPASR
jgi:hypothetical protein